MYFEYEDYLKKSSFYRPMLQEMDSELVHFLNHYHDDSRFLSGWGHGYFCSEDGERLIYDIESPAEHKCSLCGKIYKGFLYDSIYITFLRNETVVNLIKAAILYRVDGNEKYIGIIKKLVGFYAENYERFAMHAREAIVENPTINVGGTGKIMPQGLNEAIILIRIVNALELAKNGLDSKWLQEIKKSLFERAYEMLLPQKMHIHNIPCWINSAIGVMGFFYGEKKWIEEADINPFNLHEQIDKGVTDSGFWYEGSIHYNFFALEGIMNYLIFAKIYNYPVQKKSEEKILTMFDAAYRYAFDNDIFPNPSDGWPNVNLKSYSYVYYMAYKVFGETLLKYIKHIETNPLQRTKIPLSEPYYYKNEISLERLMFLPNIPEISVPEMDRRTSESFEKYNCAILRNGTFNIFFKYGHQTRSHAHPDKMNVEIMVNNKILTKDLSNSGYVSKLCNEWHRTQAAHNTCVVNFKTCNLDKPGILLAFDENMVEAECTPYDGVTYKRKLSMTDRVITDIFNVECAEASNIDYFFHIENEVARSALDLRKSGDITEYKRTYDIHEINDENNIVIRNDIAELRFSIEKGAKIYLAKTCNNPANVMRDTVIIRQNSKKACFKSEISSL